MSVTLTFSCGGCDAEVKRTDKTYEDHPVGHQFVRRKWLTVKEMLPEGWSICLLACFYCPTCTAELEAPA